MATNPEFNQNSNQTGDQSADSYTNVWDYFGDIGLNDQELADVMSGQPGVSVDTTDAVADKVDSPTDTTAGTDVSAEYRSERLQPAGEHGGASTDTASTVVKIDHSPKPDSAEVTTESPDAQPEVTAERLAPASIEPIQTLKTTHLGSKNPRLHTDEVLIALSVSAGTSEESRRALDQLQNLRGCDVHTTTILGPVDEGIFRNLGVLVTSEPEYQVKSLYRKR